MNWRWAIILVLMFFLVIFAVQNYDIVSIQFLFWSFETSRAIVIFTTLFIGIVIGWTSYYIWKKNE